MTVSDLATEIEQQFGRKLLSKKQAADYLHTSPTTLNRWMAEGVGPEYIKRPGKSGRVFYHVNALADFVMRTSVKTA